MTSDLQPEPDGQIEVFRNEDELISNILDSTSTIISSFQELDKQYTAIASLLKAASKVSSKLDKSGNLSNRNMHGSLLLATAVIAQANVEQCLEFRNEAIGLLLLATNKVVASIKNTGNVPRARTPAARDRICYINRLPKELKHKIWDLCLPPGRIYEPKTYGDYMFYDPRHVQFYQHWAPPTLREVNREARDYCMKAGQFRFGYYEDDLARGTMRSIWYNNKLDAIYISRFSQWRDLNLLYVKNLIIGDTIVLNPDKCRDVLSGACYGCDNLTIAYQPRGAPIVKSRPPSRYELETTQPVFYSIKDHERVCAELVDLDDWDEGLLKTWGEHKLELEKVFYESMGSSYKKLVRFRAVEVFRKPRVME
ncbi:hypothetical protein CSAL01_05902 [Colletotrichum salicis]|uniref:2EXR domain-containing protein n=1 Tax=Colletotrichum salicis TaxID=1209931 RepID=A0A135UBJ7_9PEZI|nr:hypothetical protein CSAL01_05902 [Colletotrichum salicis]